MLTLAASVTYQHFNHVGGLISLAVRIPSFFAGIVGGRLLGSGTAQIRFNLLAALGLLCFYYLTFYRGVTCGYTIPALGIVLAWLGLRSLVVPFPAAAFSGGLFTDGCHLVRDLPFPPAAGPRHEPLAYHVYLKTPAPSRGQLLDGILVALGITVVLALAVHLLVSRLFRLLGSRSVLERAPVRC